MVDSMTTHLLGVIGAGHMGMVIVEGAVKTGLLTPSDIVVYEIVPERAEAARQKGYVLANSEWEVYASCQYLLLAVLPQNCEDVLVKLQASDIKPTTQPVIISIVSGIASSYIRRYLGDDTPVVNVVPNIALSVGMGATALARTPDVPDTVFDSIVGLFTKLGQAAVVDERLLTEIIPVNGCAPGYAFYFIDAMARAAASQGVEYELAARMAAASLCGAAQMLLDTDATPKELLAKVCSPGGLTAKGIDYFNENKLDQLIAGGMQESAKRGYELART